MCAKCILPESLRNIDVGGRIPILFINSLRKGCPDVSHSVSSFIVDSKDVQGLIGVMPKRFDFIIQASTSNSSRGVTIYYFGNDMFGVAKN